MPRNEPAERHWNIVAGALVLAVAAAIRFREAGQTRLWFDEIYTLWVARLPLPDLLRTVAAADPITTGGLVRVWTGGPLAPDGP